MTTVEELINTAIIITLNAFTLDSIEPKNIEEKIDMVVFLIVDIFHRVTSADLISVALQQSIAAVIIKEQELRDKLRVVISLHSQIAELSYFSNIEKSGILAITSGLKEFKP